MANYYWYHKDAEYSDYNERLNSYMGELFKQYGSTPYWNEFLANPHLRTPYDLDADTRGNARDYWRDWRAEAYPAAMDYISKLIQRINNTEYDSAIQGVNRERLAGINADIAGNVGAGEASDVQEPSMPEAPSMMENALQRTAIADTVVNEGYNAIQSIISVVSSAASINGQNINNAIGSAEAINAQNELFYQNLIDATPIPEFKSEMSDDERMAAYKNALQLGFQRMNWNGISKKDRKYFTQGFENWMKGQGDNFGLDRRLMKTYKDYLADREDVVKSVGTPLYRDNIDEMIGNYMDVIGDLSVQVQKIEMEYRKALDELGKVKANIDTQAYEGALKDPNYIPDITETILGSPSVTKADQNATIAEAGARIESANTTSQEQTIEREQKKAVMLIGKAFDKAIEKVDKSPRFRTFKPYVRGTLKMMKSGTMSVVEKWLDKPSLPPVTGPAAARKSLGGAIGLVKGAM